MANTKENPAPKTHEFRELVDQNLPAVFAFCQFLVRDLENPEEKVESIFRQFASLFRKISKRSDFVWDPFQLRIKLFSLAWKNLKDAETPRSLHWMVGRDTRVLQAFDDNLLETSSDDSQDKQSEILRRLSRVDMDYRVVVVLRDLLQFADEEVVQILGLRWGVYRHRLHRGRTDLSELLAGRKSSSGLKVTQLSTVS